MGTKDTTNTKLLREILKELKEMNATKTNGGLPLVNTKNSQYKIAFAWGKEPVLIKYTPFVSSIICPYCAGTAYMGDGVFVCHSCGCYTDVLFPYSWEDK